jgi:hypothetical protein
MRLLEHFVTMNREPSKFGWRSKGVKSRGLRMSQALASLGSQRPDPSLQSISFRDHQIWIVETVGEQGHTLKGGKQVQR